MPTIVRTLPYVSPDAAGLTPVVLPDATERALFAEARLKNWWRADAGVDTANKKWRDRKADAALVPSKTAFPTQTTVAGKYNGKQVMQFLTGSGTNGALYDGGLNLLPVSSNFTVIVVGRQGSGDTGYSWGNGLTAATTGGVGHQLIDSIGTVLTQASSTTLVNTGTSTWTNANGPFIDIFSFDDDGNTATQYLSPGSYSATNAAVSGSLHITNAEFHIGDCGPIATTQSTSYYIEGGEIAEVLLFNVALHLTGNSALLATVRSYLQTRYSLSA